MSGSSASARARPARAAGDLCRELVGVLAEADELELDLDLDVDDVSGELGVLSDRERDVLGERHGIEECPGLEEDAEAFAHGVELLALELAEVFSEHENLALVGQEGSDHVSQESGFAGARAPEDDHDLALAYIEIDTLEHLLGAEGFAEILHGDGELVGLIFLVCAGGVML
jgi:hypothetical protein